RHEDEVVVAPDAQVDRALRHHTLERSPPVAEMLRLRQHVEDELERSVELPRGDLLEVGRELDDGGSMPISCHCCSPFPVAPSGSRPPGRAARSARARTSPATRGRAADELAPGCTAGGVRLPGTARDPPR